MNEFIRKLDGLGRIVIPKEYRKKLRINDDSKLKIGIESDYIKIEKYSDIDDNLNQLLKYQKTLNKYLNMNFMITDLYEDIVNKKELPDVIINKIKYGKLDVLNDEKDILFHTANKINLLIVPIILYGEVLGGLIGYSYDREITDADMKLLEIIQEILIKNIEE